MIINDMRAWNVYLNGKLIDTVFATGYDADEMRRSLINHDGYDPGITVDENLEAAGVSEHD